MTWAISRHYRRDEFSEELTLQDKIAIFTDRVRGWQLDPAEQIIEVSHHAGFIVLYAVMHYFEMIAKFKYGYAPEGREGGSLRYFKKGLKDAAPYLLDNKSKLTDDVAGKVYEKVRCCLYHTGIIGRDIIINHNINSAIQIEDEIISLNPLRLIHAIERHFNAYLKKLNDPKESELRTKFLARFNFQHG